MPADRPRRDCPACGAIRPTLLFRQRFATIAGGSLLDGYDVVTCDDCGCAYADGIPEQAAFDRYYQDLSRYETAERAGEITAFEEARTSAIADLIAQFVSNDSPILEIGCSTGRLLAELRDRGFRRVRGVDPSPACAELARARYGIDAEVGTLASLVATEEFDCLVLVGVLEHVRDLDGALGRLRTILARGGRLYAEVPDACEFAAWVDAPFQQFSTEHINFFSETSFDNVMERNGFHKLAVQRCARTVTETSTMPVLAAMYRVGEMAGKETAVDRESRPRLEEYVARSEALAGAAPAVIDALVRSGNPIVVWGVGTNTSRLLSSTRLAEANIVAFLDSNPKLQGREMIGRRIRPPEDLRELPYPVLISSRVFELEIERQIREELRCSNPIIRLEGGSAAAPGGRRL